MSAGGGGEKELYRLILYVCVKRTPETSQMTIMKHKKTSTMSLLFLLIIISPVDVAALLPPPYTIVPIPGKGFGAVATRNIDIGTLLIEETPLFSMTNRKPWFQPSESFVNDAMERTINSLSTAEQAQFYELHGYIPNADDTKKFGPTALQIYSTNAYPQGPNRSGIFPLISRLNSECIPNVHYNYDEQRQCATIHAISPITKGSEIVNSYIGLFLSRTERRQYLQSNFGFVCTCPACEPRDIPNNDAIDNLPLTVQQADGVETTGRTDKVVTQDRNECIRNSDHRRESLAVLDVATSQALVACQRELALDLVKQRRQLLMDEGIPYSLM